MKHKRILLTFLFAILSFVFVDNVSVYAASTNNVVVHYHRYDGNYEDWSIWLWQDGSEGKEFLFDSTDGYGEVATINLSQNGFSSTQDLGIIIAQIPEWNKDVEIDRYIDLSNPDSSGNIHAYILQGEEFISYTSVDQPGCDHDNPVPDLCAQQLQSGLLDAYFDSSLNLHFVVTESVNASDITVYKNNVSVGFSGFTSGEIGTLTINEAVDINETYEIEVDLHSTTTRQIVRVDADYDSELFNEAYNFDGWLGMKWEDSSTTFRVWAPLSTAAQVNLYSAGHTTSIREDGADSPFRVLDMNYIGKGVWEVSVPGDLDGVYYTFNVKNYGSWVSDIQDPYGVTFGLNGARAMVLNFDRTNPEGWESDKGIDGFTNPNEAIIYELHVRDLTSQSSWDGPDEYRGKYMGFTVSDTTYTNPISNVTVSTGLNHLKELGITHVHLLPTYDQDWNDERNPQFNWGYNPQNYNAPEGGYATDPFDGAVRVNEYKQMVMALHSNGINVINDVVYNHTGPGANYSYNRIVPNYFYRLNPDGSYSNGTGVGNETASERYMFRKFMKDSLVYWAEQYHIDGFRFDLMAVHDYKTMNVVSEAVESIDPDIFVYGEPWGGGTIGLPYDEQAGKNNLWRMPLISVFNDEFRNAIKGSPDGGDSGYVTNGQNIYSIMNGLAGKTFGGPANQSVNYVSAHDNLTLYDKLKLANNSTGYTKTIDYQARLANSIVLLSQGIPFLNSGVDFLRTKGGNSNSYDAPDSVNQLSWIRKSMYVDSFEYYKGMIEIRKSFDSFKMEERSDIDNHLEFLYPDGYGLIGMRLTKNTEDLLVYFNGNKQQNDISLPSGAWMLIADRDKAGLESLGTYKDRYPIEKAETLIFIKGNMEDVIPSPTFAPVITNLFGVMIEGGVFNLTSTSDIYSYSIDGNDYIVVDTPSKTVSIENLDVGFHSIRVKDEFGSESDAFSLQILPKEEEPLVCDDGTHEENGECVLDELICEDGMHVENNVCVLDEQPLVCEDGYELVGDSCQVIEQDKDTGCFSALSLSTLYIPVVFIGFGSIILLRKKN
jgi:pullulanase